MVNKILSRVKKVVGFGGAGLAALVNLGCATVSHLSQQKDFDPEQSYVSTIKWGLVDKNRDCIPDFQGHNKNIFNYHDGLVIYLQSPWFIGGDVVDVFAEIKRGDGSGEMRIERNMRCGVLELKFVPPKDGVGMERFEVIYNANGQVDRRKGNVFYVNYGGGRNGK